jgi:hypothetical protein
MAAMIDEDKVRNALLATAAMWDRMAQNDALRLRSCRASSPKEAMTTAAAPKRTVFEQRR